MKKLVLIFLSLLFVIGVQNVGASTFTPDDGYSIVIDNDIGDNVFVNNDIMIKSQQEIQGVTIMYSGGYQITDNLHYPIFQEEKYTIYKRDNQFTNRYYYMNVSIINQVIDVPIIYNSVENTRYVKKQLAEIQWKREAAFYRMYYLNSPWRLFDEQIFPLWTLENNRNIKK